MQNARWPGPRQSVESLSAELGRDVVIKACVALLDGRDVDGHIIHALGGPPARWAVVGGEPGPDYWLRVWALRGLLWLWDDAATSPVVGALTDEAWRVREMAAKVAARHRIDDAFDVMLTLREDPHARVRAAAARAVARHRDNG
ncbi:HEAT repeat domain-containing protein [uncultured Nocardioides sp.]|uniref:HEAT repeat domain-containing protein n=1 Tax=uncultured Nocardioides sp. TaxID=198441 RepID=UPI003451E012